MESPKRLCDDGISITIVSFADRVRGGSALLKLSDLAQRPDFALGPLLVSPSRRVIEGPSGQVNLEPVIMQVFMLLADSRGQVVTRTDLFDQVWGGVMVGDDSLNRAVGKVRKLLAEVAPTSFEIETIPRTGYRLRGDPVLPANNHAAPGGAIGRLPRRAVVGGGLALIGLTGAGLWWNRDRQRREFEVLMDRGENALDQNDPAVSPVDYFRQALSIRANDSKALGLLAYAYALRAEYGQPDEAGVAAQAAEDAVQAALRLNPAEANGRLARTLLQRSALDLAANEDRLRAILASDPRNTLAMRHLWDLLQCAGRSRDALGFVERSHALKPLAAGNNFPRAQLLWILGRTAEADRVIDRAMQYWPSHRWVRFARFMIFAFTGRERAAAAMLNSRGADPQGFSADSVALWRLSLKALANPDATNISAARAAHLEATMKTPQLSRQAVMVFSTLGEIDLAFEFANTQLLFQLPAEKSGSSKTVRPGKSTAWLFAPWLFTPPLARFRADPRFKTLCDGIGLSDYWATRRIRPDFPIGGS